MLKAVEKKVGVVVLTYNRLNLLKITISKILSQTTESIEILIVDNNSNDGTQDYLKTLKNINIIYLEENSGPAGGFNVGTKFWAETGSVDFVWLMDDDFFPSSTCLEELLKFSNSGSINFPYVREKDFKLRLQPGWWGVLIPINIIKKVGYPMEELFFWAEDTEYLQHRIRDVYNFKCNWIASSKGVHFTRREKNFRSSWRYYYEVRNTIYLRLYIREVTLQRLFKLHKSWFYLLGGILVKENKKTEKLKYFFLGTYHGLTKKLGKSVDPKGKS